MVRPFPARVVRQDRARGLVTAMSDPLERAGPGPVAVAPDPAAYDESAAALYVYRQGGDGTAHTGLVCEVAMQAFVDGRVRGHEAVQPQRVEALVRHHAATDDPPALVALLHRPGWAFTRTLDGTCRTPPILDVAGPGLRQTLWRVADGQATAAVTEELTAAVHYVADGHHRVAAGIEEWRLAGKPPDAGLLCVVHPMDGLRLSAFHRRVTGPVTRAELLDLLTPWVRVRAVSAPPAPTVGSFGLYVGGDWFDVTHPGAPGAGRADLDVAVLQARVLERLHGPGPGPPRPVEIAPALTSLQELTRRCDVDGGALFTLAPPPLEALTTLADAGEVMPPKTTYFAPKPCTGIFLRP